MADGFDWLDLLPEILNIIIAATFLVLFLVRMRKLSHLSDGSRFSHLNPYGRAIFVLLFMLAALAQLTYILYNLFNDSDLDNEINVSYMIGTWINSLVLLVEVFLMRKEIHKEQPYSLFHRLYWIYLPLITCLRLIEQCVKEQSTVDITISSVLFGDSLMLCLYSLFFKRQEIAEFENYDLFKLDQLDQLQETLRNHHALFKLGSMERSREEFQRLSVDVSLVDQTHFELKVYYRKGQIAKKVVSIEQLETFQTATGVLEVRTPLHVETQLQVKDVKAYFDELLHNWRNYEIFVLDFLAVPLPLQQEILHEIRQMSGNSQSQVEYEDPSGIFFNVSVLKVVKMRDHFEFFISIASCDGRHRKHLNKRFNQFEQLDRRLRNIEIRVGAQTYSLKPPELPDKFYLIMDEEAIDERMRGLELYARRLLNDRIFVKQFEQPRKVVLSFFGFDDISDTLTEKTVYLTGLSCTKSTISTRISGKGETSLYYGFYVKHPGKKSYEIGKRYSEFVEFNKELRRWLFNSHNQTEQRHFNFPPKAISLNQRQRAQRHTELAAYLNLVMSQVPNIANFYEFRVLLQHHSQEEVTGSREVSVTRTNSRGERMPVSNIAVDAADDDINELNIDQLGEDATRIVF